MLTKKRTKKIKRKGTVVDYMDRQEQAQKVYKIKSMIDFDEEHTNSIKYLAIEKKSNVTLTTRFMKGKMLMFSKTSLHIFVYDMVDVFCFPDPVVQKIYKKYSIEKCFLYQNLTDSDSTSLFFIFIFNLNCSVNEKDSRKILFEVMIASKIFKRLDLSGDFWNKFNVQNKEIRKQVGLYEIESIDNANIITIAVNPKEYFEKYRDKTVNKKHIGLKRDKRHTRDEFRSILSAYMFFTLILQHQKPKKIKQKRFQIIKSNMQMTCVNKTQFAGLSDQRFLFS